MKHLVSLSPVFTIFLVDALLSFTILWKFPFVDLDFSTYLEQSRAVYISKEFDYEKIQGRQGPLVYPAGHVYFFTVLDFLTKGDVFKAQITFTFLYLATLYVVLRNYEKAGYPSWALFLCILSRRVHSIYIVRCFNDGICVFFSHLAIKFLIEKKYFAASLMHSLAVSVKMSALLYSFGLLYVLLQNVKLKRALVYVSLGCALPQLILGFPFLLNNPIGYIKRSFDIARVFDQGHSYNWNFLPPAVFSSWTFSVSLLVVTLVCWMSASRLLWRRANTDRPGGVIEVMHSSKLMGILFSRSLHGQFFVWLYWLLPGYAFRFSLTNITFLDYVIIFACLYSLDYGFNRFPPTFRSSLQIQLSLFALALSDISSFLRSRTKLST
jgi:alpha-1,3-mannosyltransferase